MSAQEVAGKLTKAQREAERAIQMLRSYGCPRCNGDCGSTNPPVLACPEQVACQTLTRLTAALAAQKGEG